MFPKSRHYEMKIATVPPYCGLVLLGPVVGEVHLRDILRNLRYQLFTFGPAWDSGAHIGDVDMMHLSTFNVRKLWLRQSKKALPGNTPLFGRRQRFGCIFV